MNNQSKSLFFIWKKYQRRPEVLASLINSQPIFIPHLFKSKYLRLFDYLIKLVISIKAIVTTKPNFVFVQCPPTYSAFPALITGVPYIIDAHNPLFQIEVWQKIPFAKYLIKNAKAVIVHNFEMMEFVKKKYPSLRLFNIADPIQVISSNQKRQEKQILVIASFDSWDEPIELLIESIEELSDYTFIITADVNKLPSATKKRLQQLDNVRLTGFLPTKDYHSWLCSSVAALVLTSSNATQPSGACESLSSDTQLIISKTSLTQKLFGEWAILVDNSKESIVQAVRSLALKEIDLSEYRDRWNMSVKREILNLYSYLDNNIST